MFIYISVSAEKIQELCNVKEREECSGCLCSNTLENNYNKKL